MILRKKDEELLLKLFKEHLHTKAQVLAFGSRVDGTAHETSDLDIVIKTNNEQKLDINELMQLKEELQNSNIPILVQVLDWYRIPQSFHKNILKNYEVLFNPQT
jgi:predicted nucleotidyltransferase